MIAGARLGAGSASFDFSGAPPMAPRETRKAAMGRISSARKPSRKAVPHRAGAGLIPAADGRSSSISGTSLAAEEAATEVDSVAVDVVEVAAAAAAVVIAEATDVAAEIDTRKLEISD